MELSAKIVKKSCQKQPSGIVKKVLFAKITRKHLCWGQNCNFETPSKQLQTCNFIKKWHQRRCFFVWTLQGICRTSVSGCFCVVMNEFEVDENDTRMALSYVVQVPLVNYETHSVWAKMFKVGEKSTTATIVHFE